MFDEGRAQIKIVEEMAPAIGKYLGKEVIFGIRPENIYDKLFIGSAAPENTITATVEVIEPMGSEVYLYLTTGIHSFVARVDAHDRAEVNQDLEVVFNMAKAHFFDCENEEVIV